MQNKRTQHTHTHTPEMETNLHVTLNRTTTLLKCVEMECVHYWKINYRKQRRKK